MTKESRSEQSVSSFTLRQRAEEMARTSPADIEKMTRHEVQRLVFELQVHQIELELQNEELRQAQVDIAHSRDQFSELYEFAPTGYVTLDADGRVRRANLTTAAMLGVERKHLLQVKLSNWVDRESQDRYYLHQLAVFSSDSRQTCEVRMNGAGGQRLAVRLESIAFGPEADRRCRTALIDLTVERETQQLLQRSEQRYRRLADAVSDCIYRVCVEHARSVEMSVGANCEAITGYSSAEFAADRRLWVAMVPREDRAAVERQVACLFSGQDAQPIEHRIRRKDGQVRWVLNAVSPERDAQGSLIAYDGLLSDITQRKVAEETLRLLNIDLGKSLADRTGELQQNIQQLKLLTNAVAHLGEGVLITSDELDWPGPQTVFVNEAMCRITGYSAEELTRQSPRVLLGDDSNPETLERMKKKLSGGRSVLAELINYRKDGTPYDAELFITPLLDADGRRTHFVSIYRDISERKRVERQLLESTEQLRTVLNTAADAIITIDERGIINGFNVATERMFGYDHAELIGRNVSTLMPAPFSDEHDGYIKRYLETGAARIIGIGRELLGRRKDGSVFPVGLAVSEISHLHLFTGIVRDISEQRKLQRDVVSIAEDEQRRIGQDLHDSAQQELAGLGMLSQTLLNMLEQESVDRRSCCELAQKILDGLARAHQEVQGISRGMVPIRLDPEGLMDALRELASRTDQLEGVTCAFKCEQPVEVAESFTATHLYRIAQEAVTNALKHARPEHILIALESANGQPTLLIADDGSGFDSGEKNAGMGLKTMHYRASLMGGSLTISPVETGGTLVTCRVFRGVNFDEKRKE